MKHTVFLGIFTTSSRGVLFPRMYPILVRIVMHKDDKTHKAITIRISIPNKNYKKKYIHAILIFKIILLIIMI